MEGSQLAKIDIIYDRAALVALPENMRLSYIRRLQELTGQPTIFLISLEYETGLLAPPPFSVNEAEVKDLYRENYTIKKVFEHEISLRTVPV